MSEKALFGGLVIDENDRAVEVSYVGGEACYVVDDFGFRRHIPAEEVDRQVLKMMIDQVEGHEDEIARQSAKMLGQDYIFTQAILENQLKKLDDQIDQILQVGIPEESRTYMGMMGFRIVINVHGEIVRVDQPTRIAGEDEGE